MPLPASLQRQAARESSSNTPKASTPQLMTSASTPVLQESAQQSTGSSSSGGSSNGLNTSTGDTTHRRSRRTFEDAPLPSALATSRLFAAALGSMTEVVMEHPELMHQPEVQIRRDNSAQDAYQRLERLGLATGSRSSPPAHVTTPSSSSSP